MNWPAAACSATAASSTPFAATSDNARRRQPPPADLVDVLEEVGRILEHPDRPGLAQLLGAVAAAREPDPQRPAAHRRQHVPDGVAHHHRRLDRRPEPLGRGDEEVRVGLGVAHLVARHHRRDRRIDPERRQVHRRRLHPPAGGDRPGDAGVGQPGQQLPRPRQRPDRVAIALVGLGMRRAAAARPARARCRARSRAGAGW